MTSDPAEAGTGIPVDDAMIARYRRDGFLVLPPVTSHAELGELRRVYDRLCERCQSLEAGDYYDIAGRPGDERGPALPQVIHPEKYEPWLLTTVHFRAARVLAGRLLGEDPDRLAAFGHMILKPAGHGVETPWHQDEAYMSPAWENRGLSVWTPLDDVTVESGCLHFVPGSHRGPVVRHFHIGHDPAVRGLVTDEVDPADAIPCPVPACAATVHDCRTLHYAGPNRTSSPRRAYVLVFKALARPVVGAAASREWA